MHKIRILSIFLAATALLSGFGGVFAQADTSPVSVPESIVADSASTSVRDVPAPAQSGDENSTSASHDTSAPSSAPASDSVAAPASPESTSSESASSESASSESSSSESASSESSSSESASSESASSESSSSESASSESASSENASSESTPSEGIAPKEAGTEAALQNEAEAQTVEAFVKRMYEVSLRREADAEGLAFFTDAIKGGQTGAWLAQALFCSAEYASMAQSDEEFLAAVYEGFYGRVPDEGGKAYWLAVLHDGMSRNFVVANAVALPEFAEICARYGIGVGTYQSNEARDTNRSVTAFLSRLYRLCMGREPDAEGLNYHAARLLSQASASSVADFFFTSPEFSQKTLDDDAFLAIAYRVFFDREPDAGGVAYYKNAFENGASRRFALSVMSASPEFTKICGDYGVTRGAIAVTEERDRNVQATAYVARLYRICMGRGADVDGLNYHTGKLNSSAATAADTALFFFTSTEFANQALSSEGFVSVCYRAFLNREADAEGLAYYVGLLRNGASQNHILSLMTVSKEFTELCAAYGIPRGEIVSQETLVNLPVLGIDTSKYQFKNGNTVDWNAVKASGVHFVMIRAVSTDNAGLYEDPYFRSSVRAAKAAGLKVGVYYPLYGTNEAECVREISLMLNAMSALEAEGIRFDYPIAVDIEYLKPHKISPAYITYLTRFSLVVIEQKGYFPVLYTYSNYAKNVLDMSQFEGIDVWIANTSGSVSYPASYQMWQYTSEARVPGIVGNVDMNLSYKNYAQLLRTTRNSKGQLWNHFGQ